MPNAEKKPYFDDTGTVVLALMMGREIKIGSTLYMLLRKGQVHDESMIPYSGIYIKTENSKQWTYSEFRVGQFIDFLDSHLDTAIISA